MGKSSLTILNWIEENPELFKNQSTILMLFEKNKHEFKCEKMAMLYLLSM